jgi:hypothetical protein
MTVVTLVYEPLVGAGFVGNGLTQPCSWGTPTSTTLETQAFSIPRRIRRLTGTWSLSFLKNNLDLIVRLIFSQLTAVFRQV